MASPEFRPYQRVFSLPSRPDLYDKAALLQSERSWHERMQEWSDTERAPKYLGRMAQLIAFDPFFGCLRPCLCCWVAKHGAVSYCSCGSAK